MSQLDEQAINRNGNIVCAIMSLLKELDVNSLEVIRRDVERKISKGIVRLFELWIMIDWFWIICVNQTCNLDNEEKVKKEDF